MKNLLKRYLKMENSVLFSESDIGNVMKILENEGLCRMRISFGSMSRYKNKYYVDFLANGKQIEALKEKLKELHSKHDILIVGQDKYDFDVIEGS